MWISFFPGYPPLEHSRSSPGLSGDRTPQILQIFVVVPHGHTYPSILQASERLPIFLSVC